MNDNPQTFERRIAALEETQARNSKRIHNLEVLATLLVGTHARDGESEINWKAVDASYALAFNSLNESDELFHPSFILENGSRAKPDGTGEFDLPEGYTSDDLFQPKDVSTMLDDLLSSLAESILASSEDDEDEDDDDEPSNDECNCAGCRRAREAGVQPIRSIDDLLAALEAEADIG